MPTLFDLFGFKFLFYSNEHNPIHVHVKRGNAKAKFQLFPVLLMENEGMKPSEIRMAERVIREKQEYIAEKWNEYFNKGK